jgi:hypothetical protein
MTGISFPFRLGGNGSLINAANTIDYPTKTEESIQQVIFTHLHERMMESENVGWDIESAIFEPNDDSLQAMLRYQLVDALQYLQDMAIIDDSSIEFEVEEDDETQETTLYVNITYTDIETGTTQTSKFEIGGTNNA